MKKASRIMLALLFVVTACTSQPTTSATDVPATATLPDPQVNITPAPDVDSMVNVFMGAWQDENYSAMYALLTAETRGEITEEAFTKKYLDTAVALTLQFETGIEYEVLRTVTNPDTAGTTLQVEFNTNLFGTLSRQIELAMFMEAGEWRLQWEPAMIMPELNGGNVFESVRQSTSRGDIYAKDGSPIAAQEDAVAIGFTPGGLDENLMSMFYTTMARLTIYQVDEIIEMVDNAYPGDYIALGEVQQSDVDQNLSALSALSGVFLNYYSSRFYYDGGLAPQSVGHLTYISEEDQNKYLRQGYSINERFGSTGIEYTFEDVLSGERGASLYLKDSTGQIIDKLGEKPAAPGQSITTTIDPDLQYLLQQSLGDYRGAIVVMEIDSGRVLSMVSNPQFDPNLFDINNQNFVYADNPYFQENDPVFNRAASGQYPLGSVFKTITMAAALETGSFTKESEIYCGHSIEVCGNELFDWTYEKEKPPSGDLTLPEGLMRSCNPWFYTIGEQLFLEGNNNAISDMARAFGLGELTGIEIPEQAGNIPEQVNSCELNTQLAIGQGEMTVTPLQVASFFAAIGNGGTRYRPAVIEQIAPENGSPSYTFEPETIGTLPVSDENLTVIQDAMREVIRNGRGTAHLELATLRYDIYGKTGTAQNPFGDSHAWFAGYTQEGDEDRPDIAVAVILENAGEGSEMAAPVFRRVVSLYFSDYVDYGITLPWEAYPYVVASLTPIPTNTLIPTNTPIPTSTPIGGEEATDQP
ncbi:MAG: penicillin-binding transpeptidase domain-containing protein [Chloroflexota bacterium]|nr:penicillin-binding transpeptidase domain-containing protein [Chloroflexota bacterium]